MTRPPLILILVILALLLTAARPLICWKIDRNTLEWKRAWCSSTEFDTRPQPVEPVPTATPEPYIEPTATLDWPLPYATPTFTPIPEPYPVDPYPMEWSWEQ